MDTSSVCFFLVINFRGLLDSVLAHILLDYRLDPKFSYTITNTTYMHIQRTPFIFIDLFLLVLLDGRTT